MPQLTVRNVDDEIILALKQRAKQNARSAEAEHRKILQDALIRSAQADAFFDKVASLRRAVEVDGKDLSTTDLLRSDRSRAN